MLLIFTSYLQHGQDTQMVKRPSSCKGTGVTEETRKTESWGEASTLVWVWLLMYGSVVRPDGAACAIAQQQGTDSTKGISSSLGGKNFLHSLMIGLPMTQEVRSNDLGRSFELLVSSLPLTYPQHPQICNLGLYHGKNKAFSLRSSASSYSVIKNKTKQQQQNSFAVGHRLFFLMSRYFSDPSDKLDSNQLIIPLVL